MRPTLIILFLTITSNAFPTGQAGDILIYKGDTVKIHSTPLEFWSKIDSVRYDLFDNQDNSFDTSCWRRYIAYWVLENDSLFLTRIVSCHKTGLIADLNKFFPGEVKNKRVFASWFSELINIPSGRLLEYIHMGFESIYEFEEEIVFSGGIFKKSTTYENVVKKSDFWEMNPDKLHQIIYSMINWSNVPIKENTNVQTFLCLKTHPEIIIDSTNSYSLINGEIDTCLTNPYMRETIRVAYEVPSWNYYEKKGEILMNTFSLLFTKKQRKRYVR